MKGAKPRAPVGGRRAPAAAPRRAGRRATQGAARRPRREGRARAGAPAGAEPSPAAVVIGTSNSQGERRRRSGPRCAAGASHACVPPASKLHPHQTRRPRGRRRTNVQSTRGTHAHARTHARAGATRPGPAASCLAPGHGQSSDEPGAAAAGYAWSYTIWGPLGGRGAARRPRAPRLAGAGAGAEAPAPGRRRPAPARPKRAAARPRVGQTKKQGASWQGAGAGRGLRRRHCAAHGRGPQRGRAPFGGARLAARRLVCRGCGGPGSGLLEH